MKYIISLLSLIIVITLSCKNNNNNPPNTVCCDNAIFFYGESDTTCHVYPINVITPNGDGINDYFRPIDFTSTPKIYILEVINHTGNIIYADSTYNNDWNGKDNQGQTLPDGKYSYTLNYGKGSMKAFICIITSQLPSGSFGTCLPIDPGDPLLQ